MDLFTTDSVSAIFLVQLSHGNLYKIKSRQVEIVENIPNCPAPPRALRANITFFKTSVNNIANIHFAKFCGELFYTSDTPGIFGEIWEKAKCLPSDNLQQSANNCVKALFSSYFVWYAFFTRHHQAEVQGIIDKTAENPTISTLQEFIERIYQREEQSKKMNSQYLKMLNFANTQLNIFKEMELMNVENYLRSP